MPTVDWVTQIVFQFIATGGNMLVPVAQSWLHWISIIAVAFFGIKIAADSSGRQAQLPMMLHFFFVLVSANFLLSYWSTPMPWGGLSVHQLIPETGRYIAALVDQSSLGMVNQQLDKIQAGLTPPDFWHANMGEYITYYGALAFIWVMEGVLFALSTVGFVAIAIGIVAGPLSVAFLPVPRLNHLFWDWVQYMISWSFFQVVASILVHVWASILIGAFGYMFHGTYTALQAIVVLKAFVLLNAAMFWSCLRVEKYAAALYGHAVGAAAGYGQFLKGTVL